MSVDFSMEDLLRKNFWEKIFSGMYTKQSNIPAGEYNYLFII